jgi:deferrochelatase/peroxidase EfeB
VYATTAEELDEESATLEDGFEQHQIESDEVDVYLPADGREHFGFRDARSNPRLGRVWRPKQRDPLNPSIPYGEVVLGYRNASGHYAASPFAPVRRSSRSLPPAVDALRAMDLGRNGTYLALRKLEQDAPGFWRFAAQKAAELWPDAGAAGATSLAEHLVGRTLDGARVDGCPVGAHVRRANPRGDLAEDPKASAAIVRKHRLVRRGRLYGPKLAPGAASDGERRGLMFLALCADLGRQFEFVQEAWLNNPKFGGLTHERDPLVGSCPAARDGRDTLSFAQEPYRHSIGIERFVRVRGGAYLFMPGLRALSYLAEG